MIKTGCIQEIKKEKVIVSILNEEGCKNCGMCNGNQIIKLKKNFFPENIKVGDNIAIEYNLNKTLSVSLIFILPIIFMIAGYILFNTFFNLSEGLSILGSLLGFIISILTIKIIDINFKDRIQPDIKKIGE